MKHRILIIFTLLLTVLLPELAAKKKYTYTYDAAGNRIRTEVIQLVEPGPGLNPGLKIISASPNPTTGIVNIEITGYLEGIADPRIIVSNISGQIIINQKITSHTTTINLTGQPAGFYTLTISPIGDQSAIRIIKR